MDGDTLIIPAGGYRSTQANVEAGSRVWLLDTASFAMLSKTLNPNVTLSYYLSFFTTSRFADGFVPAILMLGGMFSHYSQGITLSVTNLNMATSPTERTATFVALANAITGPFLMLTPLLGAGIASAFGYRALLVTCLVIYLTHVAIASWAARAPAVAGTSVSGTSSVAAAG